FRGPDVGEVQAQQSCSACLQQLSACGSPANALWSAQDSQHGMPPSSPSIPHSILPRPCEPGEARNPKNPWTAGRAPARLFLVVARAALTKGFLQGANGFLDTFQGRVDAEGPAERS